MIECEVHDGVATVTLSNPPINALSREWADEFHRILDTLEPRDDWRVLRLCSSLKVFSAGGDIKQFAQRLSDPRAGDLLAEEAAHYQKLFHRIERLSRISVAEIQGVAAGGGFEIALACDLRIMNAATRVGLPEVSLGLLPSAGGTQRTARLCGRGRALRVVGQAELIPASEAFELGLVEWVVPSEDFAQAAGAIVRRLASQPAAALMAAKKCIAAAFDPQRNGFTEETEAPRSLMLSPETRVRLQSFAATSKKTR